MALSIQVTMEDFEYNRCRLKCRGCKAGQRSFIFLFLGATLYLDSAKCIITLRTSER